ncbi:acyltransferase family protein [Chiayiivirga flava]|uniref:Peptidoglycan/LPS O-acetylase OafA/YrhL n=1 Tax=Chiayiivirga flava TaxID=659595 RepID=A0A7W8D9T0_9GAMM|nr:acyltransferase [Chiayiivirga flava]MBB5209400.1 peptidoglycan/LPS O-acetylase OafA/YrhL [Chiayiivirga flava]
MSLTHQPGLDTLRAAATIAVLLAHGGYFLFAAFPHYDFYAFAGWFGTELFFALAGYLLTAQLLHAPPRDVRAVARWWVWRAWRVLPLFWCALALHVVLAWRAGTSQDTGALAYAALVQNLAWVHPAFFGEAWNLPVLLLFFFAAPVLVWCCGGSTARVRVGLSIGLCIAIALRWWWVMQFDPPWDAGVRKIVVPRLDACLYGALLACVAHARVASQRWRLAAFGGWVVAAVAVTQLARDADDIARVGLFVLCGIAGACTVAAVSSNTHTPRPLAALARWSYPLYLLNMPVLLVMAMLGLGQTADLMQALLRFVLWLAASIALAALVHRAVEQPLLRARARRLVRRADDAHASLPSSR